MNEKIYKTMSSTGACSLTVGIIVLATGIVTGIMMIVNGARLLKTKHIIRTLGTILFILYVLALIYFLFFSEEYGRAAMEERQYRYNLIPFVEIRRFWVYRKQLGVMAVVTNLFGNVIGFLPFGFILPVILDKMRSGWLIVLAGFGLSVTVEVIQLITKVGCFDVDDMILNTAGAALGYLLFFICDHLRRKIYGKKI